MDANKRTFLALILILSVFLLFQYLAPKPKTPVKTISEQTADTSRTAKQPSDVQPGKITASETPAGNDKFPAGVEAPAVQLVLENSDLKAIFNSQGGCLTEYQLKGYKLNSGAYVQLIPENSRVLTNDFIMDGKTIDLSKYVFTVSETTPKSLTYRLQMANGLIITKHYAVLDKGPGLALNISIENPSGASLGSRYNLYWNGGLNFTEKDRKVEENEYAAVSMLGKDLVIDKAKKLTKPDIAEIEGDIVYSGIRTKYFVAIMMPVDQKAVAVKLGSDYGRISSRISLKIDLQNQRQSDSIVIYLGPIHHRMLSAVSPSLDRIADTGWKFIQPISRAILWLLLFIHRFVSNYGLVIVLFSIIIKVAFFPLSYKSAKSMKHMQQLQPKMKKIQEQYKNDPGKMNQETMALYKKHGVNPLAGCLPLLLQMPVFFALYSVLANTIELRQAPFAFWIKDLAVKDPYFVLSALMGVAMFFQQKMTTIDPKQKYMVYLMPVFMVFIFSSLPAGLNLYWLVYNVLSIGEQYIIQIRHQPIED